MSIQRTIRRTTRYNRRMGHSVQITTPIPSAEEIADRLGISEKRQKMLFRIVQRQLKARKIVAKKAPAGSQSEKRAKAER